MAELSVQQKNMIIELRQAYPELKSYSDEQILSLYNQELNNIQLSEDEKISIMSENKALQNDNMGLKVETTQTAVSKEQEESLKQELNTRINAIGSKLDQAKDSNGILGILWGGFKNLTGIGDSSKKAKKQLESDLKALESGNISETFKSVTGLDYTAENVNKFLNNEIQTKSEEALNGYIEGQGMALDTIGDLISGIAAVGIYTAAIAAAPFTGGASIAVGFGAAAVSGALIKTSVKLIDKATTPLVNITKHSAEALFDEDKEYTKDDFIEDLKTIKGYGLKDLGKDLATGGFSGALGPLTGGIGGAVGKTAAKTLGIQAIKQVGKEVAEEAVEQTAKGFVKAMFTNPTGYEYIGGNMVKRGLAFAAEAATDGAIGGAIDNAFRTAYDGGSAEEVWDATKEGLKGGFIMSPVIGGGMKVAGKGAQKIFGKNDVNLVEYRAEDGRTVIKIDENGNEIVIEASDNDNLLEGGVKSEDLREIVPFAERLDNSPQVGDIIVPNKDRVEIINGNFVNGEFVPDGTSTVYPQGDTPFNKKSLTWKQTDSYPSFLLAHNKKELSKQVADILGEKKISQHLSKQIDEILEKNSDIEISDLSEIIGCLNNIGFAKKIIENNQLKKIANFKRFKENAENYAEFLYKLKKTKLGYQADESVIASASRFNIYDGDFVNFLEKVDSKDFEANCNTYLNMRGYLKNYFYPQDFLSTVHEQKVLERIQILDDFNYEYTNYSRISSDNEIEPFYKLDVLSDDKMFSELLERMEYCKKAKKYNQYHADQILHYGKDLEHFKKFDSSIPENLKLDIYKFYNEIFANCPENIDKFIEFCNNMPEDWLNAYFKRESYGYSHKTEICNLFMNFGAECHNEKWYRIIDANGYLVNIEHQPKNRTPEELLKRLEILKKVEHLMKRNDNGRGGKPYAGDIDKILIEYDIKDIDKAILFLNTVDESYLKRIELDGTHNSFDKSYNLFRIINSDSLDDMIENAKLYNALPESFKKFQADKSYDYNVKFDVDPNDFKSRCELIQKYADKLDNDTLDQILQGNYTSEIKNYERLFDLPEKIQNIVLDTRYWGGADSYIKALGILSDDGYKKFVKLISETELKDDEIRNFVSHINYRINLWEELSFEELNAINPLFFTGDWSYPEINKIRKRILQIPERMRPYIKYADESCELMQNYSSWFDSENTAPRVMAAIQRLNTLSDRDLNNIGANGLYRFLEKSEYHLADGAMFPKEKIEQLNKLPQDILERLQEHYSAIYDLLMDEGDIDVKTMISRYKLLESNGLLESGKINNSNFYALMVAGEDKFSVISAILVSSTRKLDNIDRLVGALPSSEIVGKHHDFIFDTLINNSNNDVDNISSQLNYVFNNRDGWGKSDAEIEASIEFAKKVVKDLIKRGDINDSEADNKYLLNNLFYAIKNYRNVALEFEQVKYESLMKNIDYKGAKKSEIINLYNNINDLEHLNVMDDLFNKSKFKFETIEKLHEAIYRYIFEETKITKIKFLDKILKEGKVKEEHIVNILDAVTDENVKLADKIIYENPINISHENLVEILKSIRKVNFDLAEKLLYDKKLDFPKDKISFMLNLKISSEISPIVVAEKAKKFFDLGLDVNFIKDIFENSESLTFYSDDVLQILKQRSIDDPNTPFGDVIKALVGNTPEKLQDRIDALILLAKFTDDEVAIFKNQGVDVNYKIEQLEKLINAKHNLISTTQADINIFFKAIANTQEADNVIRNADFEQFGKQGIPLQYSREDFIKRMNELSGSNFSKKIQQADNIEIPTLKMTDEDILKSKEALDEFKTRYGNNTKEYDVIINGKKEKVTRFLGSKTAGSNDGDFAMIGDKLYYLKFPDTTKLEQSVQEVMASELYRAAGIDAPNMRIMFNSDGTILGMASEYVPNVGEVARSKNLFDSFATDAWLANWDAPKNDNSAMRNGTCIKMDVGGSLEYRARGSRKDNFGNVVNELITLIEQNNDYYSMTKADVISSLKHVTNISDEQVWKIVENVPAEFRNYTLGQKMLTRRDFIKKFETIFEQMDESKYNNILDMVNDAKIQAINEFDSGTNIASLLGYEQTALGFEGLLNTRDLNGLNLKPEELAKAQKMISEIENFTKFNQVADDLPLPNETKNFLNSILKGIPEFAAYFSKPQHNGTQYSLDVHILKVLQDSLKDPDYAKLNDQDKIVLKFSTLLHDIGKRYLGSDSDTGHASLSAEYVYSILDRFNLNDDLKDRIISIVENHHWFKDFNNGVLNEKTIATLARRPQDWLIYKIMAKADLVNVSEKFAIEHVKGATSMDDFSQAFDRQVAIIEEQIQLLKEKQVVVTPTKWVEVPERIKSNGEISPARGFGRKKSMLDGVEMEFKVLNLNEISDDEDMFKYGFNNLLKKRDLRFIVHMPGDGSVKWFNVFKTLAQNPLNNSAQSLSMISVDNTSTYCGRRFGFILDVDNANISHAYYSNTGSGTGKGLRHFVEEIFEDGHHRSYLKDQFIDFLKTERGIEIDDSTYAKITEFIMSKKYPETQLRSEYKVGDKVFRHEDLVINGKTYKIDDISDAFTFSRDQLINETKEKIHGSHNEMVGLNTKIKGLVAKVNTFEELPEYFLRFAAENDLPIIIIGNK